MELETDGRLAGWPEARENSRPENPSFTGVADRPVLDHRLPKLVGPASCFETDSVFGSST